MAVAIVAAMVTRPEDIAHPRLSDRVRNGNAPKNCAKMGRPQFRAPQSDARL